MGLRWRGEMAHYKQAAMLTIPICNPYRISNIEREMFNLHFYWNLLAGFEAVNILEVNDIHCAFCELVLSTCS